MLKSILLVGDFSSIHMYNFVMNVIGYGNFKCTGYHINGGFEGINKVYLDFYKVKLEKLVPGVNTDVLSKKGPVPYIKQSITIIRSLGFFDILHIQSARTFICPAFYLTHKQFDKIILTFWGSDLYRVSNLKLLIALPLMNRADIISMMVPDMKVFFQNKPFIFRRLSKKIKVIDFGSMLYDKIDYYLEEKEHIKESFGYSSSKLLCVIGYVGRPQMQQYEAIEAILPCLINNKDKVQLAVPAYGISEKNYGKIHSILEESGIEYKIFTEFMDVETVSQFRAISDIFIHPQTSDALACAVLENLYAGTVLINGEWLNYSTLDDAHAYYLRFSSFNSLPIVLEGVLTNFFKEKKKTKINRDIVKSLSSWESLRPQWLDMYIKTK